MDPETQAVFDFVLTILPLVAVIVAISVGGWVFTTWLGSRTAIRSRPAGASRSTRRATGNRRSGSSC